MNNCAVRMMRTLSEKRMTNMAPWSYQDPLPHEPEMFDGETFLWPCTPDVCNPRLRACKHCGSLYLLESVQPKEQG